MIEKPERYIERFAEAGADIMTVHVEACIHLDSTLKAIRKLGMKAGVSLNPATPLNVHRRGSAAGRPGAGDDGQPGFRRAGIHRERGG